MTPEQEKLYKELSAEPVEVLQQFVRDAKLTYDSDTAEQKQKRDMAMYVLDEKMPNDEFINFCCTL